MVCLGARESELEHGVSLWDHGPSVSTGREFVAQLLAPYRETFFLIYFFPLLRNDLGRAQIWVLAACAALQLGTPLGFACCHSCQCFLLYSWHQMGIFSELVLTNVDERAEIHY